MHFVHKHYNFIALYATLALMVPVILERHNISGLVFSHVMTTNNWLILMAHSEPPKAKNNTKHEEKADVMHWFMALRAPLRMCDM